MRCCVGLFLEQADWGLSAVGQDGLSSAPYAHCCGGRLGIKTGALGVAGVELGAAALCACGASVGAGLGGRSLPLVGWALGGGGAVSSAVWTSAWVLGLGSLVAGVRGERAGLLVPHLVLQSVSLVFLATSAVLSVVLTVTGYVSHATHFSGLPTLGLALAALTAFLLAFALQYWLFSVVYRCYHFLHATHKATRGFIFSSTELYACFDGSAFEGTSPLLESRCTRLLPPIITCVRLFIVNPNFEFVDYVICLFWLAQSLAGVQQRLI